DRKVARFARRQVPHTRRPIARSRREQLIVLREDQSGDRLRVMHRLADLLSTLTVIHTHLAILVTERDPLAILRDRVGREGALRIAPLAHDRSVADLPDSRRNDRARVEQSSSLPGKTATPIAAPGCFTLASKSFPVTASR